MCCGLARVTGIRRTELVANERLLFQLTPLGQAVAISFEQFEQKLAIGLARIIVPQPFAAALRKTVCEMDINIRAPCGTALEQCDPQRWKAARYPTEKQRLRKRFRCVREM